MNELKPPTPKLTRALAALLDEQESDLVVEVQSVEGIHHAFYRLDERPMDGREGWEALAAAEVVPLSWVDDSRRLFASSEWSVGGRRGAYQDQMTADNGATWYEVLIRRETYPWSKYETQISRAAPWRRRHAVSLAANPDGVMTAEALVREQFADVERIEWHVIADPKILRDLRVRAGGLRRTLSEPLARIVDEGYWFEIVAKDARGKIAVMVAAELGS